VPDLPITGRCNCGGVRFEIDSPVELAGYCHCTRCQRRSGTAASAQAVIPPGAFRLIAGEELLSAWDPPDGWSKLFCSSCGSSLFSRPRDAAEPVTVRLGVIDGDPGVRPQWRQHVASAAAWEPIPEDGLPRFAGSRPR
jgi:hypothetical protein